MTDKQYEQWKDFALRMARTCWKGRRNPGRKWLEEAVLDVFDSIKVEDLPLIQDWDNSDAYPEGHPSFRVDRYGDSACPPYMGDLLAEWRWDYVPTNARMPTKLASRIERANDRGDDDLAEDLERAWVDHWSDPVSCCVRAGLDLAVAMSDGVLGFTAGDVRAMYPEGVPDWISRHWDDGESIGVKAVIPGVGFVPEPKGPCEKFADMPDNASVWL